MKTLRFSTGLTSNEYEIEYSCDKIKTEATENFEIIPNFISSQEEQVLLTEIDRHFRGIRYEYDHWDNVSCLKFYCTDQRLYILAT